MNGTSGTIDADLDATVTDRGLGTSWFARHGLSTLDVLLLFSEVLLTCVYAPFFFVHFWTPRMMLMLVAALPGLVALGALARSRDRAALAGLGLLGWSALSAVFSDSFRASFFGFIGQELTVLSLTGAVGMWALARHLSPRGRALLIPTLVGSLALNAFVGAMQMLLQIDDADLGLIGGRSIGLTPNSAYFGALMSGGAVLCVAKVATGKDERSWPWEIGAFAFAVAVSFSNARIALVSTVAFVVLTMALWRRRRTGVSAAAVVVGLVLGGIITTASAAGSDLSDRISETSGLGLRVRWWRLGLDAIIDRPVFGWGLGRTRQAIQGNLTFADVVADNTESHWDLHNLAVSLPMLIGVPGLLFMLAFAWFAVGRARGPMVVVAAAIGASWLLQPTALTTLPVVLMLLGAAHLQDDDGGSGMPALLPPTWMLASSTALGLGAAGWLGVAEFRMNSAVQAVDPVATKAAADMYFGDPLISNAVAEQLSILAVFDAALIPAVFEQLEATVQLEPERPLWYIELGRRRAATGSMDEAEALARTAIELEPAYEPAWQLLASIAADVDDSELLAEANQSLCLLEVPDTCG